MQYVIRDMLEAFFKLEGKSPARFQYGIMQTSPLP
jgi:hypothetical protein